MKKVDWQPAKRLPFRNQSHSSAHSAHSADLLLKTLPPRNILTIIERSWLQSQRQIAGSALFSKMPARKNRHHRSNDARLSQRCGERRLQCKHGECLSSICATLHKPKAEGLEIFDLENSRAGNFKRPPHRLSNRSVQFHGRDMRARVRALHRQLLLFRC